MFIFNNCSGKKSVIYDAHSTTQMPSPEKYSSNPISSSESLSRYTSIWNNGSSHSYPLTIVNVGLVTVRFTPSPSANPFVNVVFPAPRSPSNVITSPGFNKVANCLATSRVSCSECVLIVKLLIISPTSNEYIRPFPTVLVVRLYHVE